MSPFLPATMIETIATSKYEHKQWTHDASVDFLFTILIKHDIQSVNTIWQYDQCFNI